jgi:lysine-N-methylase
LHLPVVQNWDCHGCTECCREYHVHLTEAEHRRLVEQKWEEAPELAGRHLFVRTGWWWAPRFQLNHRPDGACVFLSEQGRCLIHERFGSEAKPLACRLYPLVLVPAGETWRVGLRFACPSAARNLGKPLAEHSADLRRYTRELERQAPDGGRGQGPPPLQGRQRLDWDDLLRFVAAIRAILEQRSDRLERRWRKLAALGVLCRQARFDKVTGSRLEEFLQIVAAGLEQEVPREPASLPPPGWVGRVLFRMMLALYLRKDHGRDRGLAGRGRLALLRAALAFARGRGHVPQLHAQLPSVRFEQLETPAGPLPAPAEEVLQRYYTVKIESLQFCGPANFQRTFWDGLEALALTLPALAWLIRALADRPPAEAAVQAVRIVDYNFGYNPLLGSRRQRWSTAILASRGEIERLIAWYAR